MFYFALEQLNKINSECEHTLSKRSRLALSLTICLVGCNFIKPLLLTSSRVLCITKKV